MTCVSTLNFIRLHVLGVRQSEIAALLGVSAMSWSRWESGQRTPPLKDLRAKLSDLCAARNLPWSDSWLFEVPVCNQCVGPDQCKAGCARIIEACAAVRSGDVAGGLALASGCGSVSAKASTRQGDGCGFAHGVAPFASHERQMNDAGNGKDDGDFPLVSAACVLDQDARPETRGPVLAVVLVESAS